MSPRSSLACLVAVAFGCRPIAPARAPAPPAAEPAPLVVGETFHLDSKILGQRRVVNVYVPPGYRDGTQHYPVLYMPDGGLQEDFLHIMGIVDVSIKNEVIRPMLVVGVENIERRHDLVGPTTVATDRERAPHAGGADAFRGFLRDELKPYIAGHYRITGESAITGESLAGWFVLDTLVVEPELFDGYVAVSPSVWWNDQALVRSAAARFTAWTVGPRALFLATADETPTQDGVAILIEALRTQQPAGLTWHYLPLPDEHHNSIYPVAATQALRALFGLPAKPY
jgi:predicted alpha/beta superfamily hydrolase